MEVELANVCNIDYEYDLFNIFKRPRSINKELEYLYLLIEKSPLFSETIYEAHYLEHLKDSGFTTPSITSKSTIKKNWWGSLSDIELEKKLNSKLTSLKIAKELNISHSTSTIVRSNEEASKHFLNFDLNNWLLKDPYLFSGKGFKFVNKTDKLHISNEMILEHYLDRTLDIGTIVNGSNVKHHINYVDHKGAYKGSLCYENRKILNEDEENLISKVVNKYKEEGAEQIFSIDSFFYIENEKELFLPLVEVNYRKSLGYITHKLREHFRTNLGLFFLIPSKKLNYLNLSYKEIQKKIGGVKILSPKGNYFSTFFVGGDNIDDIKRKISCESLKHYLDIEINFRERI